MKRIFGVLAISIISGLVAVAAYKALEKKDNPAFPTGNNEGVYQTAYYTSAGNGVATNGPDFVNAAEMTVHSVVHIKNEVRRRTSLYDQFFEDFFGQPYNPQPMIATGSGVIISSDGYIVTNNHVVNQSRKLEVTLNDKRTYNAEIIGTDPSTDLALIKINGDNLPFLRLADSDSVRVGEWVLAVGNPFNLTSTVTAGIVSAKARNINILGENQAIESFIQTDAAVNRGNSGGALVNTRGDLVGINAAIASGTGYYTGYSFAIPSNIVKKVVSDLMNYGETQRAFIGVTIREIDSQVASDKGLKSVKGVLVVGIQENSSAEAGGIKPDDVILKIDNQEINSVSELMGAVGQRSPGDKVKILISRDGSEKELNITLRSSEGTTVAQRTEKSQPKAVESQPSPEVNIRELGARFEKITTTEKADMGLDYGMKITLLTRGKLFDKGVREGFVVTMIDKIPMRSLDDIRNAISGKKGGVLIEGIYPNGKRAYYAIGL